MIDVEEGQQVAAFADDGASGWDASALRPGARLFWRFVAVCGAFALGILLLAGLGMMWTIDHFVVHETERDAVRLGVFLLKAEEETIVHAEPGGDASVKLAAQDLPALHARMRTRLLGLSVLRGRSCRLATA